MQKVILIFIFILIFTNPAFAEDGGYEVTPHDENIEGQEGVDTSGADKTITFWDLPLWIQIAHISGIIITFLSGVKLLPFILSIIKDLFSNKNRRRIYNYIVNNPGCSIADISSNLAISRGTVRYHVRLLETMEKIRLIKSDKYTLAIQNSDTFNDIEKTIIPHLKNETSKQLLKSIKEQPGITNQELLHKHSLNKGTINWHIKKFHNDDIITFESSGKYKKYFLNPYIEQAVPDDLIRSL
ncbi:winged helix-turn-helix transcriptional regulator [Methanohalobium evestigatum]|nr:winged helix-turn-helix transcriptional regulator [Methanohalobium evestigatum]